jgi:hypothetical protein
MDLGGWLRSLGLEKYEAVLRDSEIDEAVLHNLTEDHLRELGFPLGARLKLLDAIAALGPPNPAAATPVKRSPVPSEPLTAPGPPSATGDQMAGVTARLPVLATLRLSSRFNGTTDYQNDVAKDPNPRCICVNIGNMRKPRYDRKHDQSYRKPECPCRRRVQRHDTPPRDDQNCFIALLSSNEKLTEASIPFSAKRLNVLGHAELTEPVRNPPALWRSLSRTLREHIRLKRPRPVRWRRWADRYGPHGPRGSAGCIFRQPPPRMSENNPYPPSH